MLKDLTRRLSKIEGRDERKLAIVWLLAVVVATLLLTIPFHRWVKEIRERTDRLQEHYSELVRLSRSYKKVRRWEESIIAQVTSGGGFTLLNFFEDACRQASLTPSGSWNTRTIKAVSSLDGKKRFVEIAITVRFENITVESLVEFIKAVYNEPRVYFKSLSIATSSFRGHEGINVSLTVATQTLG